MDRAEGCGQQGQYRQADRDRTDPQLARETLAQLTQLLSEAAVIRKHALCPRQYALAFGREPDESLAPLDDEHTQALFQLFYPR